MLIVLVIVMMFTSGCLSKTHTDQRVKADERWMAIRTDMKMQLAQKSFDAGRFDDAATNAAECAVLDPTRPEAHALLIKSYLELEDMVNVRKSVDTVKSKKIESGELAYLQGVYEELNGRVEKALGLYAHARELEPDEADYLMAHAECLVDLDRVNAALKLINENRRRFDNNADIDALAALIAELAGETDESIRSYRMAGGNKPDEVWIHERHGQLLVQRKKYRKALMVLEPLYVDKKADLQAATYTALATAYLHTGAIAKSAQCLIKAADHYRDNPSLQFVYAQALLANGRPAEALNAANVAFEAHPSHAEYQLVRATALRATGNPAKATAALFDLLSQHPKDLDAHCLLAETLIDAGRIDAAKRQLEKALRIDGNCDWAKLVLNRLNLAPKNKLPRGSST
jgi:tetratricopeptide (TPR) repeat protein